MDFFIAKNPWKLAVCWLPNRCRGALEILLETPDERPDELFSPRSEVSSFHYSPRDCDSNHDSPRDGNQQRRKRKYGSLTATWQITWKVEHLFVACYSGNVKKTLNILLLRPKSVTLTKSVLFLSSVSQASSEADGIQKFEYIDGVPLVKLSAPRRRMSIFSDGETESWTWKNLRSQFAICLI